MIVANTRRPDVSKVGSEKIFANAEPPRQRPVHQKIPNMVDKETFVGRVNRNVSNGIYHRLKSYTQPGYQAHVGLVKLFREVYSSNGHDKKKALKMVTQSYNGLSKDVQDGMPSLWAIKNGMNAYHADGKHLVKKKDGTMCRTLFDFNEIYDIAYEKLLGCDFYISGNPLRPYNIEKLITLFALQYEVKPCGSILKELLSDKDQSITPKKSKKTDQQQLVQYHRTMLSSVSQSWGTGQHQQAAASNGMLYQSHPNFGIPPLMFPVAPMAIASTTTNQFFPHQYGLSVNGVLQHVWLLNGTATVPIVNTHYGAYGSYFPALTISHQVNDGSSEKNSDAEDVISFVSNKKDTYVQVHSLIDSFKGAICQKLKGTNIDYKDVKGLLEVLVLPRVDSKMSNDDVSKIVVDNLKGLDMTLQLLLSKLGVSTSDATESTYEFSEVQRYDNDDSYVYEYDTKRLSAEELSDCLADPDKFMWQPMSSPSSSEPEAWFESNPPKPPSMPPHYKMGNYQQTPSGLVVHDVHVHKIFQGHETPDAGTYTWNELRPNDDEEYSLKLVQNNGNKEMFHIEHHIRVKGRPETKIVHTGVMEWGLSYNDNHWVVGRPFVDRHPLNKDGTRIDTGAMVVIPSFEVNKDFKLRRRVLAYDFNWCYIEAKELKAARRDVIAYHCNEWKKEQRK